MQFVKKQVDEYEKYQGVDKVRKTKMLTQLKIELESLKGEFK